MADSGDEWIVKVVLIGAVIWGGYEGIKWLNRNTGTPEHRATVQAKEALEQREKFEKECAEKGLRFVGTIDDKVECRP